MTSVPASSPEGAASGDALISPERQRSVFIQKVAVLGAGTMGSRIAAHLANAGIPVVLLDVEGNQGGTNSVAAQALKALSKTQPAPFCDPASARLIQTGAFEHDLGLLSGCDWVIEAVIEDLAIKQTLLAKVAPFVKSNVILSTNTSGLGVASIGGRLPDRLRRSWIGTHFFNPPRYMRLLEIIPTAESDPAVAAALADFADRRLGKCVVYARDTPNFIANRIGVYVLMQAIDLMREQGLSVEEVDALTGSALGWPRTGTFRLADMVGLDTLAHVVSNFSQSRAGEALELPSFMETMLRRGWLGDKAGQGFYKKEKDGAGNEVRFVLDWRTVSYRAAERPKFASLELTKNAESLSQKLNLLMDADVHRDRAAAFQWRLLTRIFRYAARCLPEIADDPATVDRAMVYGFNWELGPFAMWDAMGVSRVLERMVRESGETNPDGASPNAEKLRLSGHDSWYLDDQAAGAGRLVFYPGPGEYRPLLQSPGIATLADFRKSHGVVRKNPGASLIDLGDGIAAIELHSKKNAVGEDITIFIAQMLHPAGDAVRDFQGFVITGDALNFSVGANLFQVLLHIQEAEWDELDLAVRAFQKMTSSIKFCPRPVVVAPFGLCLGGGAEIVLHGAGCQAHAELYMGLVETGVGLIPAGGGTKEMVLRAFDSAASVVRPEAGDGMDRLAGSIEYFDAIKRNFELIARAKVSTSAAEARTLGYLRPSDRITANRDRLVNDAKRTARMLAESGYSAPAPREIAAAGESVSATLKLAIHLLRDAQHISDHDRKVAAQLAMILSGGSIPPGTRRNEQHWLDLERQAFLSLCGEPKTQERIAYTLKTGKPLRN